MKALKPRPAKRGYVIIGGLSVLAVWACTQALHVTPLVALVIVVAGIILLAGAFSLRSRGINREVKRRR